MSTSGADSNTRVADKPRIAHRYVVESQIARGGMGVVYKVRDQASGAVYALKQIRADAAAQRAILLSSIEREYQVLASLDHPGIIRVFDYGVDGAQPYYTMEFVEGSDLRTLAPMPWRDACRQLRDVASALSLLHARRLIHRDLSPGNVKVTPDGRSKLLDFGALADFGYAKWVVGTPPLVAPEMLAGGMLDQRADLYALGALAYWLMTGRHAFPAPRIEELPTFWKRVPPAPSAFDRSIPGALDALVMSLLSANPLARPSSAAEVIAHFNGIAELEPEDEAERQRLARSFLAAPPFVARDGQVAAISRRLAGALRGRGVALRIQGAAGSGRSRLLEEAGVRAQIGGAAVLRVDASMYGGSHGTSRALSLRLLEALPELAVELGRRHRGALAMLGREALAKIGAADVAAEQGLTTRDRTLGEGDLADWFLALSRVKPLVLQVDNAEYVDDASLGLLVTLAQRAGGHPLVLMLADRSDVNENAAMGLRTLRQVSVPLHLPAFTLGETLELVQSMFGDAPNVTRFAEWLHAFAAGNPLLCVELSRQLVERGVVRYAAGMWDLPTSQPSTERSHLLQEVMTSRIERLTPAALELARCLSLARLQPTFALCALVSDAESERAVRALLDELAHCDIVQLEQGAYRFSSTALREVLLASSNERERETSHLRVGQALLALAEGDAMMRIEAGWHLLRGGRELEGADIIAGVMQNIVVVRRLNANMYRLAEPIEAALNVYKRHRREPYARLPLLCGLAQAGFFEDWRWDEAYADEALDMLEELSGMAVAKRLRFLGRHLSLYLGLGFAALRYALLPRRDRPFSFPRLLVQLCGCVLTSCAVAAMRLDADRAERVADLLEPFTGLPASRTGPSLYRFCHGIQQIAREHQVHAFRAFSRITEQIDDPRHFRLIPDDARVFFVTAAHFARGAFAIFRDDGRAALESAAVLEVSGLRVMQLIGAQLRYLYHMNRGELALAAPHRAEVELHAAHFGSAWQVELWESAALLPLHAAFDDATAVARLAHQLDLQSRHIPSLRRYARLSWIASLVVRKEALASTVARAEPEVVMEEPRSFIGWTAAVWVLARAYNEIGKHHEARALCERALSVMNDDDREYVTLFLGVDLEAAISDGKLGRVEVAFARLDGLLARFRASTHPLTVGLLHEARARLAWDARRMDLYERSLAEVERWFGRSQTPALVAKYERLAALARPPETIRGRMLPANTNADTSDLSQLDTGVFDTEG